MSLPPQPYTTRRVHRKLATDEEIDLRRARGEISCAECRRLKLKCDKKLPCGSCVRRGCPSICPNGSLSTGQGTRFVLADTIHLHAKIVEMGQRIRQLEDALAIFQSGVSHETHPLLREELLSVKFGPDSVQLPEKRELYASMSAPESIDAVGTLTVDDSGQAKYFGPSAGSEALFLTGAEMDYLQLGAIEADEIPQISEEVARLSNAFPFHFDTSPEDAMDLLLNHLPTQHRAWSLCEVYMEHAAWALRPIRREELVDDILSPIYKYIKEKQEKDSGGLRTISYHALAVLYLVFALGAVVDLTLESYNIESERYYHLSRACLSMRPVWGSPEIATVQAIALMGAYHNFDGRAYTLDSTWALTALACKLAQGHGLHRESSKFYLDTKIVQRRRALFWELFTADQFFSLATGRPPTIRLSYVDCEFPEDDTAPTDDAGQVLMGYYQWKYEFTKEVFAQVTEVTLAADPPNYQTLLELDRRVREKTLPPHLNVFMKPEDEKCTPSAYMRGCLGGQFRAVTLSYIHRGFFVQAMMDHPTNPLCSPYAPSFLAAYRCASGVINTSINHFDRFPELCCRWWTIWTHLFSAAITVGSIVTRSPSSTMASNAFIELGLACDLFEKGAVHSQRARSGWAVLCKLKEKAFQVYSQFRSGNRFPNLTTVKSDHSNNELALFGGQTRVIVSKMLKPIGRKELQKGDGSNCSPDSGSTTPETPEVHPSLVEYLLTIPIDSPHVQGSPQPPSHTFGFGQPVPFQHAAMARPGSESSAWPASDLRNAPIQPGTYLNSSSSPPSSFVPQDSFDTPSVHYANHVITDDSRSSVDFDTMMRGGSGLDEHWISFMKASGLFSATFDDSVYNLHKGSNFR